MSEIKEIAIKLFKNLSDALLRTAYELDPANSQASIIESIFVENPKIESLTTGDQVLILVKKKSILGNNNFDKRRLDRGSKFCG